MISLIELKNIFLYKINNYKLPLKLLEENSEEIIYSPIIINIYKFGENFYYITKSGSLN